LLEFAAPGVQSCAVHPFRFAVQTSMTPDGKQWRERARRIEALGYSTLYIPDHFGEQFGPLVALTVAAEATERLRVGTLVLDNDYRHPVVVGKELATLDLLSEGRLEVGIGAGWLTTDYESAGIPLDPPKVRVDRLEEALAVLKGVWRSERSSYAGDHYRVTDVAGEPRPSSPGGPKVVIGGGGRRMLSLAAREADIVGVNPNLRAGHVGPEAIESARPARFHERVGWVKEAAGDRWPELELQILTMLVAVVPNRREVAEQMAPAFGVDPDEGVQFPVVLVGDVEEICDTLRERRETYGFSYVVVHEPEMDAFAPVVERLAGT
jgi:probable F420-dependent oxidoreductase